jgi:hypothetical protein
MWRMGRDEDGGGGRDASCGVDGLRGEGGRRVQGEDEGSNDGGGSVVAAHFQGFVPHDTVHFTINSSALMPCCTLCMFTMRQVASARDEWWQLIRPSKPPSTEFEIPTTR